MSRHRGTVLVTVVVVMSSLRLIKKTTAPAKELTAAVEAGTRNAKWQETLQKLDWTAYWLAGDAFKAFVDSEQKRIAGVLDSLNLTKK